MSTQAQSADGRIDEKTAEDVYERRKEHVDELAKRDDSIGALARAVKAEATE